MVKGRRPPASGSSSQARNAKAGQLLARAFQLHQSQRLDAADEAYRAALALVPDHPDALHFHGLCLHQRGDLTKAIALIQRAVKVAPDYVDAHNNLGNLYVHAEDFANAERSFRRVLELQPGFAPALLNLGVVLSNTGRAQEAIEPLQAAARLEPDEAEMHRALGDALRRAGDQAGSIVTYGRYLQLAQGPIDTEVCRHLARAQALAGDREGAVRTLDRWLKSEPGSPVAAHMRAAYTGETVPERASDAYVKAIFDGFAATFDATLTAIDYRPRLIVDAARSVASVPVGRVLDAGCGTGLCGELIRPWATQLVGVDLSPKMLERANERGVYDELVEAELVAFLRAVKDVYDLIVCAEVFCYFGELGPAFDAARHALRPRGHMVFSVERAGDETEFALHQHGRYEHGTPYVERSLTAHGFGVVRSETIHLRREGDTNTPGLVVIAERLAD